MTREDFRRLSETEKARISDAYERALTSDRFLSFADFLRRADR